MSCTATNPDFSPHNITDPSAQPSLGDFTAGHLWLLNESFLCRCGRAELKNTWTKALSHKPHGSGCGPVTNNDDGAVLHENMVRGGLSASHISTSKHLGSMLGMKGDFHRFNVRMRGRKAADGGGFYCPLLYSEYSV